MLACARMVTDIRQNLREPPRAEMDWLASEYPPKDRGLEGNGGIDLVVRHADGRDELLRIVDGADYERHVGHDAETMAQVVSDSLDFERMENWLFGIFAGFALLLAVVGIYGLIQHEVELRTRDIVIRMALGSTRNQVTAQVLLRVTFLALGWSLTLALQKVLVSVIEIHAVQDATVLLSLTFTLGLIGVAASLLPARRAASINPVEALRTE
jgi:hypothetical protein